MFQLIRIIDKPPLKDTRFLRVVGGEEAEHRRLYPSDGTNLNSSGQDNK